VVKELPISLHVFIIAYEMDWPISGPPACYVSFVTYAEAEQNQSTMTVFMWQNIIISTKTVTVTRNFTTYRYENLFVTSDNQFGFKKSSGCAHAIYAFRCVTDYYTSYGSTVNVCALDLSKAFDKMNHHGLFMKLMERRIPVNLLKLLERWFSLSMTCVKWNDIYSSYFTMSCGIRQGGVLSPCLFAIYIDSLVSKVQSCGYGCYMRQICVSILLYADDILLLAPSLSSLQLLLHVCEKELDWLDMSINVQKSACMRVGTRFNAKCCGITTLNGKEIVWTDTVRYLGVYITAGQKFSCSLANVKKAFYRAFNCIFGKVGRAASENVVIELLRMKCLPSLYYGLEACPVNRSQTKSLEFVLNSAFRKIFRIKSYDVADECVVFFNCSVSNAIYRKKVKFLTKLQLSDNTLCKLFAKNASAELDNMSSFAPPVT